MRKGFTLIELLVVIAIIAILAAIVFPVIASAKLSAKKTVSVSNIKQLLYSDMIYRGDYDGEFKPIYMLEKLKEPITGWPYGNTSISLSTTNETNIVEPANTPLICTAAELILPNDFHETYKVDLWSYNFYGPYNSIGVVGFVDGHVKSLKPLSQNPYQLNPIDPAFQKHNLGALNCPIENMLYPDTMGK